MRQKTNDCIDTVNVVVVAINELFLMMIFDNKQHHTACLHWSQTFLSKPVVRNSFVVFLNSVEFSAKGKREKEKL